MTGFAGNLGRMPEASQSAPAERNKSATLPELTLLIGAEREGLPRELVAAADRVAHIPIESHSLNAAMAATVALYELRIRMARE